MNEQQIMQPEPEPSPSSAPPPRQLSVCATLSGRNVLVTGVTGFLGKCFIEKVLRSIRDVGTLFVLVRPRSHTTAEERLLSEEILYSECFTRCRAEIPDFDGWARTKLVAVSGDLTLPGAGISPEMRERLRQEVDFIVHCAANVDFNERIDRAIELNLNGSLEMLKLAKECAHLHAFLHVSTCYVNSNRFGSVIEEKLYPLDFDPEEFVARVEKMNVTELEKCMDTLPGSYVNTYTLTKSMTEHLLVKYRDSVPLAIVRPAIVACAMKEPMPGWVEGLAGPGALIFSVAYGVLKFLPGDARNVGDLIPVDYVINSMLVSLPAVVDQDRYIVTQASSSVENPFRWGLIESSTMNHLRRFVPPRSISKPAFMWIRTPQMYQIHFFLRYSIPGTIFNTIAKVGGPAQQKQAALFNKLLWRVRVLNQFFSYFTTNQWFYDNRRNRELGARIEPAERDIFPIDISPQKLDWAEFSTMYVYGLYRYIGKEDMVPLDLAPKRTLRLSDQRMLVENRVPTSMSDYLWPDLDWTRRKVQSLLGQPQARISEDMEELIFTSEPVQKAIDEEVRAIAEGRSGKSKRKYRSREDVEARARAICSKMFGHTDPRTLAPLAYVFRKVWKRIYDGISVDAEGLARVQEAATRGPLVFVPTHRSYVDFLVISYMCFACELPLPHIAAGEDFLGIALVRSIFRRSGAFFIRRSFSDDALYTTIFKSYVEQLLLDGQSLEFFIEGTRSRSGKMLHPKTGLLGVVTDAVVSGKISNATIVPVAINYEKTMESNLYSDELMGSSKVRESLRNLLNARQVLNVNFGEISVNFGELVDVRTYADQFQQQPQPQHDSLPSTTKSLVRTLGYDISYRLAHASQCMPTHLVATLLLMYRHGVSLPSLVEKTEWLRQEVMARGGEVKGAQMMNREEIVLHALKMLGSLVVERRKGWFEPAIASRPEYGNLLSLGHYRNRMIHLFFDEGLWACALFASGQSNHHEIQREQLLDDVQFLSSLLERENIYPPGQTHELDGAFERLVTRGTFVLSDDGLVSMAPSGETHFSFLCALLWPFIDSYYCAALGLFALQPAQTTPLGDLLQHVQSLAMTMYHDSMLSFFESCSKDTLSNALKKLKKMGVIQTSANDVVSVSELFKEPAHLTRFVDRIDRFRKPPVRRTQRTGQHLVAEIPMLAKL